MVQPTRATAADWCEAGGKVRRAVRRRSYPAPRGPKLLKTRLASPRAYHRIAFSTDIFRAVSF